MTSTKNRAAIALAALVACLAALLAVASSGAFAGQAEAQTPTEPAVTAEPAEAVAPEAEAAPSTDSVDADAHSADYAAFEECLEGVFGQFGNHDFGQILAGGDDFEALDAEAEASCMPLLPEHDLAMIAEMEPFETCFETETARLDFFSNEPAAHAAFEAAEATCEDLLPAGWAEAGEAFEACLADNGIDLDMDLDTDLGMGLDMNMEDLDGAFFAPSNTVIVITEDGEQIIELGDGVTSVTINSDGENVSVESSGDVEITEVDWAAEEAAFEACGPLLPGDLITMDMGFGPDTDFAMSFDELDLGDAKFGDANLGDAKLGDAGFRAFFGGEIDTNRFDLELDG